MSHLSDGQQLSQAPTDLAQATQAMSQCDVLTGCTSQILSPEHCQAEADQGCMHRSSLAAWLQQQVVVEVMPAVAHQQLQAEQVTTC